MINNNNNNNNNMTRKTFFLLQVITHLSKQQHQDKRNVEMVQSKVKTELIIKSTKKMFWNNFMSRNK